MEDRQRHSKELHMDVIDISENGQTTLKFMPQVGNLSTYSTMLSRYGVSMIDHTETVNHNGIWTV